MRSPPAWLNLKSLTMGKRCDYRAQAMSVATTDRQRRLVSELLTGRRVPAVRGGDGAYRVGVAGLHSVYFSDLRYRLQGLGFLIRSEDLRVEGTLRKFYRLTFPGEGV